MSKLSFIILVLCCLSCRSRSETASKEKFLTLGSEKSKLLSAVTSKQIRVCLTSMSSEISSADWQQHAEKAIATWIEALRPISDVALVKDIQIINKDHCEAKEFDHVIQLQTGKERSSHWPGESITTFYVGDSRGYAVLLHESGHAMGLADTYEGRGKCKPGQPQSVMCNCDFFDLQKDDIVGIRVIFATYYTNFLKPEIRKKLEEQGFQDFAKEWFYRSDKEKNLEASYKEHIRKLSELDGQLRLVQQTTAPELAAALAKKTDELAFLEEKVHGYGSPYFKWNQLADKIRTLQSVDFTNTQIAKRLGVTETIVADPATLLSSEEHESIRHAEVVISTKTHEMAAVKDQLDAALKTKSAPYEAQKTALMQERDAIDLKLAAFRVSRNELYSRWLKTATEIFVAL